MTRLSLYSEQAGPTKQHFVSMLTRDGSLNDTLLDNCLNGAMRIADGDTVDYAQRIVRIKLARDEFSIKDNCGGILSEVAINYAFKMGQEPDDEWDSDSETTCIEVVRHLGKLNRQRCEERQAAAPTSTGRTSPGRGQALGHGTLALVDASEAEPKSAKAKAATRAKRASRRSFR